MPKSLILCGKELKDLTRSRALVSLIVFLAAVVMLSVLVAAADFRIKIDDYNNYVAALRSSGGTAGTAPPQLAALQMLRGGMEYLEIVGSLFAVILGYGLVAKERGNGTLQLIFSRPLGRYTFAGGKILAVGILWTAVAGALFAVITATLLLLANAPLQGDDYVRLGVAAAHTALYLTMWSLLAFTVATLTRTPASGLILALVIWLVVVLVIPQIGDTMDPDNQIPGGLFASLQVDKTHEQAIMANFSGYETARDLIEQTSMTKQFERPLFAWLGIKDQYNGQPFNLIWAGTFNNTLWLMTGFITALTGSFLAATRTKLLRKVT